MTDAPRTMTTESGHPVANNRNPLNARPRGPMLMQDDAPIERVAHLDRKRVPGRVVHTDSHGAHGTFTLTHDVRR